MTPLKYGLCILHSHLFEALINIMHHYLVAEEKKLNKKPNRWKIEVIEATVAQKIKQTLTSDLQSTDNADC